MQSGLWKRKLRKRLKTKRISNASALNLKIYICSLKIELSSDLFTFPTGFSNFIRGENKKSSLVFLRTYAISSPIRKEIPIFIPNFETGLKDKEIDTHETIRNQTVLHAGRRALLLSGRSADLERGKETI